MITVTRLNGQAITINALLIESLESTPDTVILLTTGKRLTVREKSSVVVDLIKDYMQHINYIRLDFKTKEEH